MKTIEERKPRRSRRLKTTHNVIGKAVEYVSDDDDNNSGKWWTANVNSIPGISRTAIEKIELVVYYDKEAESEALNSIKNLRESVNNKYKKETLELTTLNVVEPRTLLATPKGSCWLLVDWFQNKPEQFPGVADMRQRMNKIEYRHNKQERSTVSNTIMNLQDILAATFTEETVNNLMGDEYYSADDEKMQMETGDDKPIWKLYYREQFSMSTQKWK